MRLIILTILLSLCSANVYWLQYKDVSRNIVVLTDMYSREFVIEVNNPKVLKWMTK